MSIRVPARKSLFVCACHVVTFTCPRKDRFLRIHLILRSLLLSLFPLLSDQIFVIWSAILALHFRWSSLSGLTLEDELR